MLPFVSIVVPVYGPARGLGGLLAAIAGQDYPSDRFECLLVDNGTEPPLQQQVAHRPNVRVLVETRPGSYAARNCGLHAARGEVIAFTDADCLPEPTWLSAGVNAFAALSAESMIAGAIQMVVANPARPTLVELHELTVGMRQDRYVRELHFGATANLFVPRAVFDRVGEFRAELFSNGDAEWGRRAWKAGVHQHYAADAVVKHPARRTYRDLRAKSRRIAGGLFTRAREERQSLPALIGRVLARGGRAIGRIIRNGELRLVSQRMPMAALEARLRLSLIGELLRLSCGRPPRRC